MPLRDDLLNPIPGDNPSGESLRYAPVYDQIKEARREEEDIAQGEWQHERKKADWPLVVELASEALATKSKDLQLAAWLAEAMLRREGFAGLDASLGLIRSLLENFWDTLYPEIEDGDLEMRAVPLEWVGSRLDNSLRLVPLTRSGLDLRAYRDSRAVPYETDTAKAEARSAAVEEGKLTPEEFDQAVDETPRAFYEERMAQIEACLESVAALGSFCDERFGDLSPNLNGLKKSLEEVKQVVHVLLAKKRQQEPGEEPAGYEEPAADSGDSWAENADAYAAAAPARAPRPRARGPLAPEPADRDDALARVVAAARWLRQNDAYGPAGYMLVRAFRWGELMAGAPEPDASLLEAPATETRQEIKRLFNEGSYQEALEAAESAIGEPCGRAWLDVHRYAVQCCDYLGYYAVSTAIKSGLRALLADIPGLLDASLMDDTPTANAETRQWIEEQVAPPAGEAAAGAPAWYPGEQERQETLPEGEAPDKAPDAQDLAMQAMQSGDVRGAIEILSRGALTGSGRARFQRRIQLAQMCLGTNHAAIARPILEGVAAEIDRRDLEAWEAPETIAHALTLLYHALHSADASPEEKQKLYSRICRLDPVQALSLPR